jgi:hypothetical protein
LSKGEIVSVVGDFSSIRRAGLGTAEDGRPAQRWVVDVRERIQGVNFEE